MTILSILPFSASFSFLRRRVHASRPSNDYNIYASGVIEAGECPESSTNRERATVTDPGAEWRHISRCVLPFHAALLSGASVVGTLALDVGPMTWDCRVKRCRKTMFPSVPLALVPCADIDWVVAVTRSVIDHILDIKTAYSLILRVLSGLRDPTSSCCNYLSTSTQLLVQ
ncbi:hypothetical protein FPV67DRAFT_1502861 [Lyophyllum atratum]|nr:hypothetical protein FPV67DRAFT_1502861 [Lyophyllum atratum]